jgi:HD superfamily phosphohydrolase
MGDSVQVKAEIPNPQSIGYIKEEKLIRGVKRVPDAVDMVKENAEGMEDSSRLLVCIIYTYMNMYIHVYIYICKYIHM